jgi:DNA integrity scanning protein DisA with diadenylate cyclase activity
MNNLDKQYQLLLQDIVDNKETIQETVTRFINKGVYQTKITPTELSSAVIWSKTRKCLVGSKYQPNPLEVVEDVNGNLHATYDNNVFISLQNRSELTESDVREINESEGIVVTNATYGKPYFRFGFIPN